MRNKILSTLLIASILTIIIPACEKDDDDSPSQVTLEEVLTAHTWKMESIRFLQNNTFYTYRRGGSGNSLNFDTDVITFNANRTGTYVGDNINYTLTWEFADATKTKVVAIINYPTPLTVTLENFNFTETSLKYTEYYTRNGVNTLASVWRTPL